MHEHLPWYSAAHLATLVRQNLAQARRARSYGRTKAARSYVDAALHCRAQWRRLRAGERQARALREGA